jgi:hypothetical protein
MAITQGIRDENQLTNLIFFARHPDRQGRRLTQTDPQFKQLAQEWLQIRESVVRPTLRQSPGAGVSTPSTPATPYVPTTSATPRLIKQENQPPAYTLYVEIPLGLNRAENKWGKTYKVEPMTGIFIPPNYSPQARVELIVYLHGHKSDYPGDGVAIDGYWAAKQFPFFALREAVSQSGKNVILVAPTLGPLSQAGTLVKPGGFDAYLDQVLAALGAYGPYRRAAQPPTLGNIILACHSGGGSPMLKIALNQDRYTANIQEYWGFDCLYSGYADKAKTKKLFTQPQRWLQWAAAHTTKKLFIYFQSSTKNEACYLARLAKAKTLSNVGVVKSKAKDHFWVPFAHWQERSQKVPVVLEQCR